MAQYPQQNFHAMRQDAIRRSREMQRRAVLPPKMPPPAPIPSSEPSAEPPSSGLLRQLPKELQNILTGWDSERLAMLALLYLLYKDGADFKLLLAIAYILL